MDSFADKLRLFNVGICMTVPLLIASAMETGYMAGLRRDCRPCMTFPLLDAGVLLVANANQVCLLIFSIVIMLVHG